MRCDLAVVRSQLRIEGENVIQVWKRRLTISRPQLPPPYVHFVLVDFPVPKRAGMTQQHGDVRVHCVCLVGGIPYTEQVACYFRDHAMRHSRIGAMTLD